MKKIIISILILNFLGGPLLAAEFDTSINDEIRKNYNPDKLEEDVELPALPKIMSEKDNLTAAPTKIQSQTKPAAVQSINAQTTQSSNAIQKANVQTVQQKSQYDVQQESPNSHAELKLIENSAVKYQQSTYAVLKQGTKFDLKIQTSISDKTKKGNVVKFVTLYPVSTTYLTIPMGTVFYGKIEDSHRPQLLTNGGLLVVHLTSMEFAGKKQQIDAVVTKVNSQHIYFNNIKGKHRYFKSMQASMKPGFHFFKKMMGVSGNLMSDGSSIVVAPFSLFAGIVAAGGNIMLSPVLALTHRGAALYVNTGSYVQIKLIEDVRIYN